LQNVYSEPSAIEMGGTCSTYEMRNAYADVDGNPVGEFRFLKLFDKYEYNAALNI